MQKTSGITINLVKNRGESFVDRFIGFSLTIGRLLVVGTEIVALSAFLYRFTLDRSLVGLHDTIIQQETVVQLLHNNELLFRGIQDRLNLASLIMKQSNQLPTYLITIETFAPSDMDIHTIAVANDAVRIQATVQSVDSLTKFVNKLKGYTPIKTVSIDRIDNQIQISTINVNITGTFKKSAIASGLVQKGGNL